MSTFWDDYDYNEQQEYLKKHPKSKLRPNKSPTDTSPEKLNEDISKVDLQKPQNEFEYVRKDLANNKHIVQNMIYHAMRHLGDDKYSKPYIEKLVMIQNEMNNDFSDFYRQNRDDLDGKLTRNKKAISQLRTVFVKAKDQQQKNKIIDVIKRLDKDSELITTYLNRMSKLSNRTNFNMKIRDQQLSDRTNPLKFERDKSLILDTLKIWGRFLPPEIFDIQKYQRILN